MATIKTLPVLLPQAQALSFLAGLRNRLTTTLPPPQNSGTLLLTAQGPQQLPPEQAPSCYQALAHYPWWALPTLPRVKGQGVGRVLYLYPPQPILHQP